MLRNAPPSQASATPSAGAGLAATAPPGRRWPWAPTSPATPPRRSARSPQPYQMRFIRSVTCRVAAVRARERRDPATARLPSQ
eukprot:1133888-Alexandrium_andersonii.AAC.1